MTSPWPLPGHRCCWPPPRRPSPQPRHSPRPRWTGWLPLSGS